MLAFVLCLGLTPCAYAGSSPFNDVAPGFWAYDAILETYSDGVMTGTASGVFSPVCYYMDLLTGVNEQGTFAPKGLVNCAQTAVIYARPKKAISTMGTGTPGTPGTTNPGTTAPGTHFPRRS